jgi:hypothetical protein
MEMVTKVDTRMLNSKIEAELTKGSIDVGGERLCDGTACSTFQQKNLSNRS